MNILIDGGQSGFESKMPCFRLVPGPERWPVPAGAWGDPSARGAAVLWADTDDSRSHASHIRKDEELRAAAGASKHKASTSQLVGEAPTACLHKARLLGLELWASSGHLPGAAPAVRQERACTPAAHP